MGYQIIRERDGETFALFASETETFILRNRTASQLIDFLHDQEAERIANRVTSIVLALANGEKPYHQFTLTLDEAEAMAREHDGCGVCGIQHDVDVTCGEAMAGEDIARP